MNTTTTAKTLGNKDVTVTFVGGNEYGFCHDLRTEGAIAIVGVTGATTVEKIAQICVGEKGVFVAREIVRLLNCDQASEINLSETIKSLRAALRV